MRSSTDDLRSERKTQPAIQANRRSPITSVWALAPHMVAGPVLIGARDEVTPLQVRYVFGGNAYLTALRLSCLFVCYLVFVSRCVGPEGPWQRRAFLE